MAQTTRTIRNNHQLCLMIIANLQDTNIDSALREGCMQIAHVSHGRFIYNYDRCVLIIDIPLTCIARSVAVKGEVGSFGGQRY